MKWPAAAFKNAESPIVIGILGTDPFGRILDETVRNETVGGRRLAVKRYARLEEMDSCHILFISDSMEKDLDRILAGLKGRPVFTVSGMDRFVRLGGMARFFLEQNKVRIRINPAVIREAGLEVSSKLLRAAEIVGP